MANSVAYIDAVKRTFRSRALRTVLIVDDQFPTYENLLSPHPDREYTEEARALSLYKLFKEHDMPCDIENKVTDVDIERIRKSDLIILDYHLIPGSQDPSKSIDLIRRLAETKHFNTVVLYTEETDHAGIWRNLLLRLRRGWVAPDSLLEGDLLGKWEQLSDTGALPSHPSDSFVLAHATSGQRGWPEDEAKQISTDLRGVGITGVDISRVVEALVHRAVRARFVGDEYPLTGAPQVVVGEFSQGGSKWLQSRNCFVAILGKQEGDASDKHPTDARRILECLDEALAAWHPNLLQVLISEIQNMLELEALATDEAEFQDPAMHAGLTYFLLNSLEERADSEKPETLDGSVQVLIDKIVETLRHRLGADESLRELGSMLLAEELKELGWPTVRDSRPAMFAAAVAMARTRGSKPSKEASLFALNSFLSTERFRRSHVTAGTIFRSRASGEYWACASPGCDMVVRQPVEFQVWMSTLHPLRPMMAVRLHPEVNLTAALNKAHQGRHAFVSLETHSAFAIMAEPQQQPVFEVFFAEDAARCHSVGHGHKQFTAARVKPADSGDNIGGVLAAEQFEVVGQLRPSYAAKILTVLGQHLSRVGLDYVSMPL
ncbi:MAG: hypothetical protein JWM27_1662 [Gemmatimonadetes bacterium]|nr:hypothetical protein [Gemmatimonadota bacterium]